MFHRGRLEAIHSKTMNPGAISLINALHAQQHTKFVLYLNGAGHQVMNVFVQIPSITHLMAVPPDPKNFQAPDHINHPSSYS